MQWPSELGSDRRRGGDDRLREPDSVTSIAVWRGDLIRRTLASLQADVIDGEYVGEGVAVGDPLNAIAGVDHLSHLEATYPVAKKPVAHANLRAHVQPGEGDAACRRPKRTDCGTFVRPTFRLHCDLGNGADVRLGANVRHHARNPDGLVGHRVGPTSCARAVVHICDK